MSQSAGRESRLARVAPPAALFVLLASASACAADLPRVFFSPAERAAITAARLAGGTWAPAEAASAAAPAGLATAGVTDGAGVGAVAGSTATADAPARTARVDGITVGRGTTAAVWIGGARIVDGGRWGRYRVRVTRDGARLIAADGSVREVRVGMELRP